MDFERGAHYLVTMNHRRFPAEPFEAVYAGSYDSLATMYHNFVVVDEAFIVGVPEDQVGFDFKIEPLRFGNRNANGLKFGFLTTGPAWKSSVYRERALR